MFITYDLRLSRPPTAIPAAAITGPRNITETGCLALVIATMFGTFGTLRSPVSAGWVAMCTAPNVNPITRATMASTSGAFPPRAMMAHINPAITAVTNITANCITVHRVDAW